MGDRDLLPCPWPECEGNADVKSDMPPFFVQCRACDSQGPHCETEDEAVIAWNRRASSTDGAAVDSAKVRQGHPSKPPEQERGEERLGDDAIESLIRYLEQSASLTAVQSVKALRELQSHRAKAGDK